MTQIDAKKLPHRVVIFNSFRGGWMIIILRVSPGAINIKAFQAFRIYKTEF